MRKSSRRSTRAGKNRALVKRRYGGTLEGVEAAKTRFRTIVLSRSERDRFVHESGERCRVAAEILHEMQTG